MGAGDDPVVRIVIVAGTPPGNGEVELTLFGPGYGESMVLHVGDGAWVLVDSCLGADEESEALRYLTNLGLDPARAVVLVVATHWHDDHIRGMTRMVETCRSAAFCCAAVLCKEEFLSAVSALEGRHHSSAGSGVREIHGVFSRLSGAGSKPLFASADRRILERDGCEIWSLSPGDAVFQNFLWSIGRIVPGAGQAKTRIPDLFPNEAAVALWIRIGDVVLLLGSDLEKRGWTGILRSAARPTGKASLFKLPHHGSEDAHEPGVWEGMLDPEPFAVLTPWRRGAGVLPNEKDVQRILSCTKNAYATAKPGSFQSAGVGRDRAVDRTVRESGIRLRRPAMSPGALRLRRPRGARTPWTVETFGSARRLDGFTER